MTYSIVARDPETGNFGAAVQSHWFAAGDVCWAEPGVGAVATQATVLWSYGPVGLERMRAGATSAEALSELTAADEDRDVRQVAMIDHEGRVAVHTGARCIRDAGHRIGEWFSCQANMMRRATVWDAMHDAFLAASGDLADRLLAALEAAEAEGGDIRGRQAARILVVRAEPTEPAGDVLVDLRVDDHPAPLVELRRLLDLKRAYDHLEAAEERDLAGDHEGALEERRGAIAGMPDNPEAAFWTAVSLAEQSRMDEARPLMVQAVGADVGWGELLRRLAEDELIRVSPSNAEALLAGADG